MNKLLSEMPNLGSEAYAPVMPKWFTNLLRLVSLSFAIATVWGSVRSWVTLPWWVQILVCILVPVFFFAAIHSNGWAYYSSSPFLLADRFGMYFKHKNALTTHIGKGAQTENSRRKCWLFVPWENISNIRVSKVKTHEGSFNGAMLDVKATADELDSFFGVRQADKDKITLPDGSVSVGFYMNVPPTPRKVVTVLQEMISRHKKSPLRAKYERAE